jgi:hypothetical protein
MNEPVPQQRRRLTDSPWYWVYLFCTGGLIALLLMGPRFAVRQAQIERNDQARQRAARQVAGQAPDTRPSSQADTAITLAPLATILVMLLVAAWIGLCVTYVRRRRTVLRDLSP